MKMVWHLNSDGHKMLITIYDMYYWIRRQIGNIYFQFAFPYHVPTNSKYCELKELLSGELLYEVNDDVLVWLEENDIKSNSWTSNMEYNAYKMTYVIGFKNKVDAMAFKLRWT